MTTADCAQTPVSPVLLLLHRDVLVRSALGAYLRECGYTVIETTQADEVRQLLRTERDIDIAFIDIEGEGSGEGFEIAQTIRKHRPSVQVLLAASVGRAAAEAGELCEQGPMLARPYDHQILERNIRRLLAR